ncbi:hypothetical protein [Streptomyces sp. CRN 30]|uniref:hypothetical protein n=1 Tax=Streptomyces sp. CRN 30 TaxID=3075613 RepID=UPI002A80D174|nr:hypothetical protein [Streptomyces sp. CRN 30]
MPEADPSATPQVWDPTTTQPPSVVGAPDGGQVPDPPQVPKGSGGGSGKEVVNTASLDLFAKNIEALVPTVIAARDRMRAGGATVVQPGAFYDAYQLRSQTSGPNGGAGLQERYYKTLADLAEGLADISRGAQLMSKKYTSTEELNAMKTSDLEEMLAEASADFQRLADDSGARVSDPNGSTKDPTGTTK